MQRSKARGSDPIGSSKLQNGWEIIPVHFILRAQYSCRASSWTTASSLCRRVCGHEIYMRTLSMQKDTVPLSVRRPNGPKEAGVYVKRSYKMCRMQDTVSDTHRAWKRHELDDVSRDRVHRVRLSSYAFIQLELRLYACRRSSLEP